MRTYSPYPLLIDVCVTNRCNLHCSYCSAEAGPFASKKDEMSIEKLDSIFQELDLMGVPRVGVTGGEPFIGLIFRYFKAFDKYSFANFKYY